jgi:hypothetical protein
VANLNTTYRAHDSAHNTSTSVNGAIAEATQNMGALSMQMAADRAVLNRENSDGGQVAPSANSGMIGMFAQTLSKYGTTAVGAAAIGIGGPAGIALGTAALAVDVAKFVAGGKSAEPAGEGNYLKASYEKMTKGGVYKKADYDPIVTEGYTDSLGGFTAAGGGYATAKPPQPQQPAQAAPSFMQRMVGQFDEGEEAVARKRLAKSENQFADNKDQLDSSIGYARRKDMDVKGFKEGPTPPTGAMGGFVPGGFA